MILIILSKYTIFVMQIFCSFVVIFGIYILSDNISFLFLSFFKNYYYFLVLVVILIGIFTKWGSAYPRGQSSHHDPSLDDDFRHNLVYSLEETKYLLAELKSLLAYNLNRFVS